MHDPVSERLVSQAAPQEEGGVLTPLVLVLVPPPQDAVHGEYAVQVVSSQSTANKEIKYNNYK